MNVQIDRPTQRDVIQEKETERDRERETRTKTRETTTGNSKGRIQKFGANRTETEWDAL